jgi:sulfur relay (sulfurtransferase) DsrF/TusC family protein
MKVLQVIDQSFRTTVEEQDDTILWLTQSMHGAGGDLAVLLSGHGCYYAVQSRRQPALSLGDWQQTEPADITQDIARLTDKNVPVYVLREDLEDRGVSHLPVLPGIEVIARAGLPALYESVDQIWNW